MSGLRRAPSKSIMQTFDDQTNFRNRFSSDPTQIKRISSFSKYRIGKGREYGYAGAYFFKCGIERHKGSFTYMWLGRVLLGIKVWQSMLFGEK